MEYAVASVKKDVDACKFNWSCNFGYDWAVYGNISQGVQEWTK